MIVDDAVTQMEQMLRGMVAALNLRDEPSAALEAQRALAILQGLRDELDAWMLHDVQFEEIKIARDHDDGTHSAVDFAPAILGTNKIQ